MIRRKKSNMKEFEYKAFISYSHKDIEYARKIQKKLEKYKIPYAMSSETRHFKIFRDETDLTSGELQENLNKELDSSEYLIVICSPDSAKPSNNKHWVNAEVQHFKDLGREKFIIPVIIRGIPNATNDDDNCYCPALAKTSTEDEFLGIDADSTLTSEKIFFPLLRKLGIPSDKDKEEKSFIHIIARILSLRFDSLWNREKKSRTRKGYLLLSIFIIICIFLVLLFINSNIIFLIENLLLVTAFITNYITKTLRQKNEIKSNIKEDEETFKLLREEIRKILDKLSPSEKDIISARFGLDDGYVLSLEQIADVYNINIHQVRKIEKKLLTLLKDNCA